MKTLTAPLHHCRKLRTVSRENWLNLMAGSLREVATLAVAALAVAAVVTLSVWLAGIGTSPLLGAGTWGLGFVFLGLAVDSQGPSALLRAATGVTLPVLALMQDRVSSDFALVTGVVLAAWAGYLVLKRLSVQDTK